MTLDAVKAVLFMPLPRVSRSGKTSWTSILLVSIVSLALLLGFSGLWRLNARGGPPKQAGLGSSQAAMSAFSSAEMDNIRYARCQAAVPASCASCTTPECACPLEQMLAKCKCCCMVLDNNLQGLLCCRSRAKAAVLGAFVADAATMPLHWIYDPAKIQSILGDSKPEFFPNASSPFYTYELGELSPYGAEALYLLQSIVEHGRVNVRAHTRSLPHCL